MRACGFSTKRGGISIGNTSSLCAAGCQRVRWWFVWFCRWVDFLLITSGGLLFPAAFFFFVSDGILFVNSRKSGQKPDTPPQQNARPRRSLRGRLPYVIYSPRRRVQRCTSSMVGIDGAAPGRDTAMAAARDARSRHSSSGRPAAIQATK